MLLDWLLALFPILLILLLMIRFRWGAAKAGPAGWFAALCIAVVRFGAGLEVLAVAQAKSLFFSLDVLMITWAAFLLFRVVDEGGAIQVLKEALFRLTTDPGMQALLIAWAFASFLQGVGGYGVPVAVTAPIMIGLGFSPVSAVVLPSLGHGWSVTFGSLAASFQALIAATGIPGGTLARPTGLLLGLACFGCGLAVAHATGGWKAVRRLLPMILLLGGVMAIVQLALAVSGFWNLGATGAGIAGLAVGVVLARYAQRKGARAQAVDRKQLLIAVAGYAMLVLLTLVVQLAGPVKAALSRLVLQAPFPEVRTALGYFTAAEVGRKIPLLSHAGAILAYTSLLTFVLYRRVGLYTPGAARRILAGTTRRMLPSSLGIASMVAMALVMSHAGMTDVLARGLAASVGRAFPVVSPWIGALGAFMTGSNTNSNVVFALLQSRTAELLGYPVALILAAQTAGAAIGSVVAPTKVVVGASTAGKGGEEGGIVGRLLGYVGLLILAISLVVWVMALLSGSSSAGGS